METRHRAQPWWSRGIIISSAIAALGTVWLWSRQNEVLFNGPGDIIFLIFVVGCVAPVAIQQFASRTKKIVWISLTAVLWFGWMFFFNGIALFGLPLIVGTAWMFKTITDDNGERPEKI